MSLYCFVLLLPGSGKTAAFLIPMFERLKTHTAKVTVLLTLDFVNRAEVSFLFCLLGLQVREKKPLLWVKTHCVEHLQWLLSDQMLM